MKHVLSLIVIVGLAGCADGFSGLDFSGPSSAGFNLGGGGDTGRPEARPETPIETEITTPPPAENARTVEQFDTTTPEDRAEAVAVSAPAGEQSLGKTVASLGAPTEPGFWLKTPLVSEVTQGRVVYLANGKTVNVELRPTGGEAGSGSQLSLPAMRLIEAPLTGLPEIEVFAG